MKHVHEDLPIGQLRLEDLSLMPNAHLFENFRLKWKWGLT